MSDNQITHELAEIAKHADALYVGATEQEKAILERLFAKVETIAEIAKEAIAQRDAIAEEYEAYQESIAEEWESEREGLAVVADDNAERKVYDNLHNAFSYAIQSIDPRYEHYLRELPMHNVLHYAKDLIYNDRTMTAEQAAAFIAWLDSIAEVT